MATAVDTNVLVELLAGAADVARTAREVLERLAGAGALVLSPVVWAELLAYPGRGADDLAAMLHGTGITVARTLEPTVWRCAADAFSAYAGRRRAEGAGQPRRLLADFLIGAHASAVGALLTRDVQFYRRNFPELRLAA